MKQRKHLTDQNFRHRSVDWRKTVLGFVILFLAYSRCISGSFLIDDMEYLVTNPHVTQSSSPLYFWTNLHQVDYWPLFYTVLWILWGLFENNPFPYHLICIFIHGLNCFWFGRILDRYQVQNRWLPILIFALHPVQVEAVAWIFQLKTLLSTLFFLVSFDFYIEYDRNKNRKQYFRSLTCFLLALLSKTSVVLFPVTLILHHIWKADFKTTLLKRIVPFFVLSAIVGGLTVWVNHQTFSGLILWQAGFLERILTACYNFWFYLGKLLFPFHLCFVYPWKTQSPGEWTSYISAVLLFCVFFGLGFQCLKKPEKLSFRFILVALGFYFFNLFPALGLINVPYMRYTLVADRWQYLASFAAALLLSELLHRIPQIVSGYGYLFPLSLSRYRQILYLIPTGLFILTWMHAADFSGSRTLWVAASIRNPGSVYVYNNLGVVEQGLGHLPEAEAAFRKVISIQSGEQESLVRPEVNNSRFGLAMILFGNGMLREAEQELLALLKVNPTYPNAYADLGLVLQRQGRLAEASEAFLKALNFTTDRSVVLQSLCQIYRTTGSPIQAISLCQ